MVLVVLREALTEIAQRGDADQIQVALTVVPECYELRAEITTPAAEALKPG